MRRTYLDTGVLIVAAAGRDPGARVALEVLNDPARVFLSCPYLDLELLPQVILNHKPRQKEFLETYLAATQRIEDMDAIFQAAFRESSLSPVSGMDALHIAAAHLLNADEFITTEKTNKPIYRNSLVDVICLDS